MRKLMIVFIALVCLSMSLTACAPKERVLSTDEQTAVLEYGEPLAENIFSALQSGSYDDFTRDMDDAMLKAMPEKSFNDIRELLATKAGAYESRSIKTITESGDYMALIYAASYEKSPEVTFRIVITKAEPHKVSGLWMNSPELSK